MSGTETSGRRLLSSLADYQSAWIGPDVLAGVAVAALLVPESIGYAKVAGLPPEVGLFAAPLALVAYALFGSGRVVVVATASAVSAVSASVVGDIAPGPEAVVALSAALAVASGLVYLGIGLARMGWVANFMSQPVLEGFIVGLSLFIIAGQLDGLAGVEVEGEFALARMVDWAANVTSWDPLTLAIGVAALALLFALHEWAPKVPGALVVLVLGMVAVAAFDLDARGVEVVGELPTGLPSVGVPAIAASDWLALVAGAFAVTLVGFSEGFAAVNAFHPAGEGAVDVDRELVAMGASNVGAGLSSGMVVGASLSKSAAADGAGARSQVATLTAAVVVVLALLVIGPVFAYLPEAVLAAVVIHAVWGLVRVDTFVRLRRIDVFDGSIAIGVLVGTLLLEPIQAVLLGVAASVLHLVARVSFPHRAVLGWAEDADRPVDLATHAGATPTPGVLVYRMDAPLLFVNSVAFRTGLDEALAAAPDIHAVVVDGEALFGIDAQGLRTLERLATDLRARGITMALARLRAGAEERLDAVGLAKGPDAPPRYDRVEDAVDALGGSR